MAIDMSYGKREVEAAHRVLIEIMQVLGEYRDQMVIIGGWVPTLHLGNKHIGSMDIDIALDKEAIHPDTYSTIRKLLQKQGYRPDGTQPFIFYRDVDMDGGMITIEVDFLASEYGGTAEKHRTQHVQDIRARKARGCDLAFDNPIRLRVSGMMPNGAENEIELNVCRLVPFIVMKGMALHDRSKDKDAYDIYFCLKNISGGVKAIADEFQPFIRNKLVVEGLRKIQSKFKSITSIGPIAVVDFMAIEDREERVRLGRDVFETVRDFLGLLPFDVE